MLTYGSQVNPSLGRVDYSPLLQGAMARAQGTQQAGQMYGQMLSNIGQQVSQSVREYVQRQEEKQKEKDATTFFMGFINNNPQMASSLGIPLNLKGEVTDPGIVKTVIKSLGGPDKAIGIGTSLQKFEQDKRMMELQADAALRQAEIDRLNIAALQDAAAKRAQDVKNIEAATKAYGAVPQRIGEKVTETVGVYTAPTPRLQDFLYSSGAATTSPAAVKVNPIPKDIQDFALRDPNTGFYIGIDPRTVSRFAAEQRDARAPIVEEIAKLSAQVEPVSGVSRGPGAAFIGMGAGRPSSKVESQIKAAEAKLEAIDKETRDVFSKIRDWESNRPSFKTSVESLPPSSLVQKAAKQVEKTVERDATTDEKASAFVSAYIKGGGMITPEFIDKSRDAFKTEMAVYDAGDGVMAVRVGNSAQIIDRGKPLSAAQVKEMKAEQYQKLLSGLAESSEWESLPIDLKKTISELAAAHEKGQNMLGTRMSGQEAFVQRRQELLGAGRTSTPAAPVGARPAARPTTTSLAPGWSLVR